jgi:hypothetical protein
VTRRTQIKKELTEILKQTDLDILSRVLQIYKPSDLITPLFSALYNIDELIRWHAVSAFGLVVDRMARQDMESGRIIMRRFLWSLNDESGGIGWGAPEAMAEIMAINEDLFQEYGHMLFSYMREDGPESFQDGNFIELPELQRGVIWGVGRLADIYREILIEQGVVVDLVPYLRSSDGVVRGMALWALAKLSDVSVDLDVQRFKADHTSLGIYENGVIIRTTISNLACQYLVV